MGKLTFVLTLILYFFMEILVLVDYVPYERKIVLATLAIYYPTYPLTYFQVPWLEKFFGKKLVIRNWRIMLIEFDEELEISLWELAKKLWIKWMN